MDGNKVHQLPSNNSTFFDICLSWQTSNSSKFNMHGDNYKRKKRSNNKKENFERKLKKNIAYHPFYKYIDLRNSSENKRKREESELHIKIEKVREMEMKKLVLVKVALLFLFICFTASNVDARSRSINPGSFIIAGDNYNLKSTTSACCDACACTKSIPPICHCHDFGETCHSACNLCICTASYPPQCRCLDQTTFCYDKCDSSEDKAHSEWACVSVTMMWIKAT